jgi:flagellar biosynthesis component FlhA
MPDRELAINPGRVFGMVEGIETRDPAFGMEADLIESGARAGAVAGLHGGRSDYRHCDATSAP